ncbi:DUF4333 domain-containing protein [Nocardia sp. NPDC005978]|uniref:DUF4333 domain-containing protein n=1 Tax=Nocardia sp. NPDC005978 TaxID=3156725 RepID=UPI0033A863D6
MLSNIQQTFPAVRCEVSRQRGGPDANWLRSRSFLAKTGRKAPASAIKLSMRKLIAALPLVFVPILVAGCNSGPGSVSKSDVESKTGSVFHDTSHEDAKSVVCEGDLDAKVDATQKCAITSGDGQTWSVLAKVTKVEGDTAYYDLDITDKYVAPDDVASNVSNFYQERVGTAPKASTCTGLLRGATGTKIRCVVTEADGTRWGVTATTTNVEGDQVNYDMIVDDQPLAS